MADQIHVGDGIPFTATFYETVDGEETVVDISGATTKQLRFRKPDATLDTKAGAFETDGTDGQLTYDPADDGDLDDISDFLDTAGFWEVQGYVVIDGRPYSSTIHQFEVFPNIDAEA
jgi:hypothetical protein